MRTSLPLLFLLLGLVSTNALAQNDSPEAEQKGEVIMLRIEGMACQFCARNLKSSLEELGGITIDEIDPREGFAKLSFGLYLYTPTF